MTTIQLYNKHKAGEISREKFLYEVRRDNKLPFITNLTSYNDAVKILKNKGIVTEVETKEAKADEVVKAEVKAKAPSIKKPKSLSIDVANPYEYRHGLQYELTELDDYSDEALEKAKDTVLKNLAKDTNFYSSLLNQKQSPYEFKAPETDAPGMQAKADGYLKKELKKDEKANVKDSLSKSEAAKGKPKGVKELTDKGVEGKEKVVKEGIDDKVEDMIKSGKIKPEEVKTAAEKAMKGDSTSLIALMAGIKLAEDQVEEAKKSNEIEWISSDFSPIEGIKVKKGDKGEVVNHDTGDQYLVKFNNHRFYANAKDFKELKEELNEEFKYFDNYEEFENTLFQLYPQVKANPEKYKKTWKNGEVSYSDGYVNWGSWYPDRPQSYSGLPPGAVNMNNKMSQSDLIYPAGSRMDEHHNDPNFPGGTKIHAMLDKVADEWGKDSDVYNDLEDSIVGWSNKYGELSPKGILAIKALLSNWDMLDDYEQFLGEDMELDPANGDSSAEGQFNDLVSKYDWYHEMSDDPRKWDMGTSIDQKLKSLAKTIGVDKAVELFNDKAPSDRKVTSTFFAEDKHAKIKEALKAALQKEGDIEDSTAKKSAIQTEKAKLIALNKTKSELMADKNKTKEVKDAELKGITLKMRAAQDSLNKLNSGKIDVV